MLSKVSKYLISAVAISTFSVSLIVYAFDSVAQNITPQSSTLSGSNNSITFVSTGTTASGTQYYTQYMNRDNDSAIIGNYFHGFYYDTQLWFFELDWDSTNPLNNVRVIDSTDRCPSGYGYKLGGFAKGVDAGFVNFNYSSDIFVYYCEIDKKLHGYAYDEDYGFESFEGIGFTISATGATDPTMTVTSDPFFVNNNSNILTTPTDFNSIQDDQSASDWWKSTIFYIVK